MKCSSYTVIILWMRWLPLPLMFVLVNKIQVKARKMSGKYHGLSATDERNRLLPVGRIRPQSYLLIALIAHAAPSAANAQTVKDSITVRLVSNGANEHRLS